ncbi:MAG: NMD3-related protein [Thermoplasmata archaeon]
MKCIVCGKNEAKINGLCEECFLNSRNYVKVPKNVEIVKCPRCDGIKIGNTWHYGTNVDNAIMESLQKNSRILDDRISWKINYSIIENQNLLDVDYIISINGKEKVEKHQIPFILKKQLCPRCSKYSGDYFESILQVRFDRKMDSDEINEIENFIFQSIDNEKERNSNLYLLKKEEKDGGMDFYLSSNTSSRVIAKKLAEKYGASLKESPHLAGVKDGKDFYRITFSIRFPDYKIGDFIKVENSIYMVLSIKKGQIKVKNLKNGNVESITQKYLKDKEYKIFASKNDIILAIKIYEEKDYIHFLETVNYKIFTLKKPPFNVNDEFHIVREGEEIYIIPD